VEGLETASTQFRGFAAECVELAQKSRSLEQRTVYVRMASTWHKMALHWEKDFRKSEWAQRGF
jgi:hypothetical protein